MKKQNRLILIDGSAYIFRAYYALPPMSRSDGTPVNAVFGFTNMLVKLIEDYSREKLVVIFDAARENFRNKIYPAYKANRGDTPEDLIPQFALIKNCVKAFNMNSTEASVNQNDFTLFALSKDFFESDPWSINCAQYFGYGLVSHFPCSVNCKKTSEMSKSSARLLRDVAPNLALDFIKFQGYCYIYTEYDGVSAFKETFYSKKNIWHYNPKKIEFTGTGLLTQAIMKGNRIIVKSPFNFNIYNEEEEIMKVNSNSASILFHKKSTDLI